MEKTDINCDLVRLNPDGNFKPININEKKQKIKVKKRKKKRKRNNHDENPNIPPNKRHKVIVID